MGGGGFQQFEQFTSELERSKASLITTWPYNPVIHHNCDNPSFQQSITTAECEVGSVHRTEKRCTRRCISTRSRVRLQRRSNDSQIVLLTTTESSILLRSVIHRPVVFWFLWGSMNGLPGTSHVSCWRKCPLFACGHQISNVAPTETDHSKSCCFVSYKRMLIYAHHSKLYL